MGRVGVLVVHGIGDQRSDFADEMIERLGKELGSVKEHVFFRPAWWAPIMAELESGLLRNLSRGNDLDYRRLRKFVIQSLGDAIAYQEVPSGQQRKNIYGAIHRLFAEELHALRLELRAGLPSTAAEAPLIVIAHSLGCHMVSNHVWDVQHGRVQPTEVNAFERAETLAGMVTFGCNIALFSLAHNAFLPIKFPGARVLESMRSAKAEQIGAATHWLNFYDPDDVLGWPLKPLSPEYDATVTRDIAINAGGLLSAWNPASHLAYWTDRDVIRPTAQLIRNIQALAL
jgi:hypothetical protein